jgi:hypothetical protein
VGNEILNTVAENRQIKIRKLKYSDFRRVKSMIEKLADKVDDKSIFNIISNTGAESSDGPKISDDERKTNIIRVFIEILKRMINGLHDDVVAWFADLIGVTVAEYDEMPIDIDIIILEQLKNSPDVDNFFIGASHLFNGTQWLRGMFGSFKTRFDSAMGATTK